MKNLTALTALLLSTSVATTAAANDVTLKVYRYADGYDANAEPALMFVTGERLVFCVTMTEPGYLSVWDVGPDGDEERFFPDGGAEAAIYVEAGRYCVGGDDTFPIGPVPGEVGPGRLHALVSATMEPQAALLELFRLQEEMMRLLLTARNFGGDGGDTARGCAQCSVYYTYVVQTGLTN